MISQVSQYSTYGANNWWHLLTSWDFKKSKHICDDGCSEWFRSHQETWLVAFCNWQMARSFGTKSHETGNTSHSKILFQSVSPNSSNIFTWMIQVRRVITPNTWRSQHFDQNHSPTPLFVGLILGRRVAIWSIRNCAIPVRGDLIGEKLHPQFVWICMDFLSA